MNEELKAELERELEAAWYALERISGGDTRYAVDLKTAADRIAEINVLREATESVERSRAEGRRTEL